MAAAVGLFACVSMVVGLCAKHAVSKISKNSAKECNSTYRDDLSNITLSCSSPLAKKILNKISSGLVPKSPPGSPLRTSKKILATISSKAITPFLKTTKKGDEEEDSYSDDEEFSGFGEEGVWQKCILMGDKCEPLDFSGAIYYDHQGNQIPALPRSPKTASSPLPSFTFPVLRVDCDSDLVAV